MSLQSFMKLPMSDAFMVETLLLLFCYTVIHYHEKALVYTPLPQCLQNVCNERLRLPSQTGVLVFLA